MLEHHQDTNLRFLKDRLNFNEFYKAFVAQMILLNDSNFMATTATRTSGEKLSVRPLLPA
jgi:hypothetical protein